MAEHRDAGSGRVVALWRFPVKSMMGEELNAADVTARGLVGDRAFALIDTATGKVASAKSPRAWPNLFDFRAAFTAPPEDPQALPPVRITFPDGASATTDQPDIEPRLSDGVGRPVRLAASVPDRPRIDGDWPDEDGIKHRGESFEVELPAGTFFDLAPLHLVTTATLDRLRAQVPRSRFEVPRFRPNLVIALPDGAEGFPENDWVGRTLAVGAEVRLQVVRPCPRCIMTTLAQGDLPKDPAILRAAVQHNEGNVGVYATVVQGGRIRRGDVVTVA